MINLTISQCLHQISTDHGWDDWTDVVFNSESRRTIFDINEKAIVAF